MNFIKNIFSTIFGLIIFTVLVILILSGSIAALSDQKEIEIEANSILHLKMNRLVTEQEIDNPLEGLGPIGESSSLGLKEIKEAIKQAATNDLISGIYLDTEVFYGGMATLNEIRDELQEFKSSGKFIYAYGEYFSEGGYYLASVADKVYVHPEGELELNGLNANVMFLKKMFDKFGIEPQIFRVGDFKSAVEPFMREDMSDANRLQLTELLSSINGNMITDIAESRGLDFNELMTISDSMQIREIEDAVTLKVIDDAIYEDEFRDLLKEKVGVEKLKLIKYSDFKTTYSTYSMSPNKIAVIIAEGDIIMGKSMDGSIGSDEFVKMLRDAREDENVKAIVLRVNSPGGSYLASDIMWREIQLAKEAKPVIASMGDYAASGGYYLSMSCDTIVAQPTTITGSIGIFAVLLNFEKLLEDKIGITSDEVNTGQYSGMYTVSRSLTDAEKAIIQKSINGNYKKFITKAAEGRNMEVAELEKIASGRVWSGDQALKNGLVDVLGSLNDAIDIAASKANVTEDYAVRYFPEQKPFFEKLVEDLGGEVKVSLLKSEAGELYPYINEIKKLKTLQGDQARLPYKLEIN